MHSTMEVIRQQTDYKEPIKALLVDFPDFHLEWKDLTFSVAKPESNKNNIFSLCRKDPEKFNVLNKASGHTRSGELVAVLGSSGAGKTTLLAAISQRLRGDVSGHVTVNNRKVSRREMTEISGFLPQFEIQCQSLTAYEHLYFMAQFKMDRRISKTDRDYRVHSILFQIGMRYKANTRISHLSGGERRRLSLAEELLKDPPFIFCDEPTTGLDIYSAYSVIQELRKLCTKESNINSSVQTFNNNHIFPKSMQIDIAGISAWDCKALNRNSGKKAIICSIHQPTSAIFELFTHIILVDAGTIIYQGCSADAMSFFTAMNMGCPKNSNLSDHIIKVMTGKSNGVRNSDVILRKYESQQSVSQSEVKSLDESLIMKPIRFKRLIWAKQVYYLLRITILEDIRDIRRSLYGTFFFLLMGFFIVTTYTLIPGINQASITEISGSLYIVSSQNIYQFIIAGVNTFPTTLPRIRRETGEKTYSLSAYIVALIVVMLPRTFIKSSIFFSMFYLAVSYTQGLVLYLKMLLAVWMSAITATSYGLFISSIFESPNSAGEIATPLNLVFLAVSGAFLNVDYIPYLKYFSLFYYTNEAMMNVYWRNVTSIDCFTDENGTEVFPCIRTGIEVLQQRNLNSTKEGYFIDIVSLVVITIIFMVLSYLFIRRFIRRSGYY